MTMAVMIMRPPFTLAVAVVMPIPVDLALTVTMISVSLKLPFTLGFTFFDGFLPLATRGGTTILRRLPFTLPQALLSTNVNENKRTG